MIKNLAIAIALITTLAAVHACNSDDDNEVYNASIAASNVRVTKFSLAEDDSVLVALDSVYFSIDLMNASIFNADSLPVGTDVRKLVAKISYGAVSEAEITFKRADMTDSVFDYLNHSTDSIDFSNGPAKLRLVSSDGKAERTYTISVNVHKMKPDSLYWNELARQPLPTGITQPTQQRTVRSGNTAYCLTSGGGRICMASTENPADGNWDIKDIDPAFTPDVSTLAATDDAIFILDNTGALYTSADGGTTWTATGSNWHSITGGYGNILLGIASNGDGTYSHVTYPASTQKAADKDFPISGASTPLTFESKWSQSPQAYILGGEKADGTLSADTWAYDGTVWAKVSNVPLPKALRDVTMFPYFSFITNASNWKVTEYTVLMAIGGRDSDGNPVKDVYISYNMGMDWRKGGDLLMLPDYIPAMWGAQGLVYSSVLTQPARSASQWTPMPIRTLPRWLVPAEKAAVSRATHPITEWDCPYIYLFGGYAADGSLYPNIWRGAINRLTFKPLQ